MAHLSPNPLSLEPHGSSGATRYDADGDDDEDKSAGALRQRHSEPKSGASSRSSSCASSSYRRNNPYSAFRNVEAAAAATDGRGSGAASTCSSPHSAHSQADEAPPRGRVGAVHSGGNPLIDDDELDDRVEPLMTSAGVAFQFSLPKSSSSHQNDDSSNEKDESDFSTSNFLASGALLAAPALDAFEMKSLWVNENASTSAAPLDPSKLPDLTSLPNPKAAVCTSGSIPVTPQELEALVAAAPPTDNVPCPPGWNFSVYDSDISQHYAIESKDVSITQGAIKYVDFFQKYGTQTRFRFQLCKRFLAGWCASGASCQYIHSQVLSHSTQVHVNENCATSAANAFLTPEMVQGGNNTLGYKTIAPGVIFPVYPPNSANVSPQSIPSEKILVTTGAQNVFNVLQSRGGDAASCTSMKPRHCAHFQFKRMCNLGSECNFIHSLVPYIQGVSNSSADPYRPQAHHAPPQLVQQQIVSQLQFASFGVPQATQQPVAYGSQQYTQAPPQGSFALPAQQHVTFAPPVAGYNPQQVPLVPYTAHPQQVAYGLAPQHQQAIPGSIPQHQQAQMHQQVYDFHQVQYAQAPPNSFVQAAGGGGGGGIGQQQHVAVYFQPQPVALQQYVQLPQGLGPSQPSGAGLVQYYPSQPQPQGQPYLQFHQY